MIIVGAEVAGWVCVQWVNGIESDQVRLVGLGLTGDQVRIE